jgi:ankyrin repeat protein
MIPTTNLAFQTLEPDASFINFRIAKFQKATLDLINAVSYANENEMAMLVDRAISNGAKINYHESYESHLMVIAVNKRQPHAIPILMARGLVNPTVPQNGIDILMEAASKDYEELIDPLIAIANMDLFSKDLKEKTVLHHAVIGGSLKIVKILLEYGANPNVFTLQMDDAELRSLFGDNHNLKGVNVTPLMIASAAGNHEMTSILLTAGADPTHSECLPLALACIKGHAPTIKILLAHQTKEKFSSEEEQAILSIALENGASLECLRLIVSHHCFDDDDGTINSPLGLAIKSKQPSNVSLLLGSGAQIEKFNAEENTLWDEAFINEKKSWELLDLLVTTSPMSDIAFSDQSKESFLVTFFENCQNPIPLAALGFYPSVVETSRDTLQQLHSNETPLATMEKQLLAAFILSSTLKILPNDSDLIRENSDFNEPDRQWLKTTHEKKQKQNILLLEETLRFTKEKFSQLKHALSLEFFIECNNLCPIKNSLKNFILNKLLTDSGIPFKISESIASIWSQAAQWGIEWYVSLYSISEANRFLSHLTKNLFNKIFSRQNSFSDSLHSHCLTLINDELGMTTYPLHTFCTNPVAWLRKFENRNNLRAVHVDELANSLQIEFGLHISTCQSISTAWSTTINLARQSPQWKNSAELDKLLAAVLATEIEHCISDEFAQRIIPQQNREDLVQWAEGIKNLTTQNNSNTSRRKRTASGDPEGTPTAKEARL